MVLTNADSGVKLSGLKPYPQHLIAVRSYISNIPSLWEMDAVMAPVYSSFSLHAVR